MVCCWYPWKLHRQGIHVVRSFAMQTLVHEILFVGNICCDRMEHRYAGSMWGPDATEYLIFIRDLGKSRCRLPSKCRCGETCIEIGPCNAPPGDRISLELRCMGIARSTQVRPSVRAPGFGCSSVYEGIKAGIIRKT